MDEKYSSVKNALSCLCGIPAHLLRLAEVSAAQIKVRVPEVLCGHMSAVCSWQSFIYRSLFSANIIECTSL